MLDAPRVDGSFAGEVITGLVFIIYVCPLTVKLLWELEYHN